ncbi:MAG: hypothetical protein EP347_09180 [Alphaproteobacteria bacterium]|nr:MAG: hypothetical protein EP347_09180 [Alphaproteobacteria bacterium]
MKLTPLLLAGTALTVLIGAPALANSEKQDTAAVERQMAGDHLPDLIKDRVFTDDEKSIIEDYYRGKRTHDDDDEDDDDQGDKGASKEKSGKDKSGKSKKKDKGKSGDMPQGLAKRDELPPGLQMQLEKNGTLPPGLEKRRLPSDLDRRLPRRLDGISRYEVGQDVILLDDKSSQVLDIIRGVAAAKNL